MNQSELAEAIIEASGGEYDYTELMEKYTHEELLNILSQYGYYINE